ncbi:MAG: hypothetical protein E7352_04705 [Clostridiales bacterium]|nr:hypothetical protein [Clostridiales bacterium]
MKTCAFFGSKIGEHERYKKLLFHLVVKLIEEKKVTRFYSGGRGKFDVLSSEIVDEARRLYPYVENILALSYLPTKADNFILPNRYTASEYLLERRVPSRYAIIETNKLMINRADFVIVATQYSFHGAKMAREYAEQQKKAVIDIEKIAKELGDTEEGHCVLDAKSIEELLKSAH